MWIHERVLQRAQQCPQHLALVLNQEHMTYGELARRVERVAAHLLRLCDRQAPVALHLAKSPAAIVMMLACLRAGMTYVPIDPKCPPQRRDQILRDCQARLLVLDAATAAAWAAHPCQGPSLAMLWSDLLAADEAPPPAWPAIAGGDLAYVLYTSGSTGQPRGVMITHGNAEAFVAWGCQAFLITPADRVAVHAPLHFDLPVFDIYVGLAQGAALFLLDESTALFPEALSRFLRERQISVLYAVPSALTALIMRSSLRASPLLSLRILLYAGEEFRPEPLYALMQQLPAARVFNLYGPVETNVVTQFEITREQARWARVPLGMPVPSARLFLLGEGQRPVQEGEGEIAISGPSVSPGYVNQPQQTQATRCTVQDAEGAWPCYRTGDFARRDAAGLLHFLGRRDGMVKTRGFRVELGEIEAALARHPAVAEVAVVAAEHPVYTTLLYAFVVYRPGAQTSERDLLSALHTQLPAYMCPHRVFVRAQLPTTSTGKVARLALRQELPALLAE